MGEGVLWAAPCSYKVRVGRGGDCVGWGPGKLGRQGWKTIGGGMAEGTRRGPAEEEQGIRLG